jgi:hypothetical protein
MWRPLFRGVFGLVISPVPGFSPAFAVGARVSPRTVGE